MKKHRLLVSALLGAVLSISAVEPPLADVDVVVAGGSLAFVDDSDVADLSWFWLRAYANHALKVLEGK